MNKLIGELAIELNGKSHILKPTFGGLTLTEDRTGKSLSQLVQVFLRGHQGVRDVAGVIFGGMYGANDNKMPAMSMNEIGEAILASGGLAKLSEPCMTIVSCAYSGKTIDEAVALRESLKKGVEAKKDEPPKKDESPATSPSTP